MAEIEDAPANGPADGKNIPILIVNRPITQSTKEW